MPNTGPDFFCSLQGISLKSLSLRPCGMRTSSSFSVNQILPVPPVGKYENVKVVSCNSWDKFNKKKLHQGKHGRKGIQDSLGFWIQRCGFRIPDSRYRIPDSLSVELGSWISIFIGILDSLSCIPDSKAQDSGFHSKILLESGFHKQGDVTRSRLILMLPKRLLLT